MATTDVATTQTQIDKLAIVQAPVCLLLEKRAEQGVYSPLPTGVTRAALIDAAQEIADALAPGDEEEVLVAIERLRANYPEFEQMPDPVLEMVMDDMLSDLAQYPFKLLVEACARWRQSPATRAPTSGQLMAMVAADLRHVRRMQYLVQEALEDLARQAA